MEAIPAENKKRIVDLGAVMLLEIESLILMG